MKGQFFIISTVIMISALILITNYLYDYGITDLTNVEQMQELNYIGDIQNSLRSTVEISCDEGTSEILESNLILAESNLHKQLLEKGIEFDMTTSTPSCSGTDITFTLSSAEFEIENTFSV